MSAVEVQTLSPGMIDHLRKLAQQHLGIEVRPGKELLVSLRAAKHMRELGLRDCAEYLRRVEEDSTGAMLAAVLDRLTTNHTAFYREAAHFDFLRQVILQQWRSSAAPRRGWTIWSAASSSGEEPYTLAMCGVEELSTPAYTSLRILATDVSDRMLEQGRAGVYCTSKLDPLPSGWREKYFLRGRGSAGALAKIRPELHAMVHFRKLNLTNELPRMGPFPVIFCRNVMIYFDSQTRARCVSRLAKLLEPGGYLFVGHAESVNGIEESLEYVQPAVYRRIK